MNHHGIHHRSHQKHLHSFRMYHRMSHMIMTYTCRRATIMDRMTIKDDLNKAFQGYGPQF